jgi:hypothetical protein
MKLEAHFIQKRHSVEAANRQVEQDKAEQVKVGLGVHEEL